MAKDQQAGYFTAADEAVVQAALDQVRGQRQPLGVDLAAQVKAIAKRAQALYGRWVDEVDAWRLGREERGLYASDHGPTATRTRGHYDLAMRATELLMESTKRARDLETTKTLAGSVS